MSRLASSFAALLALALGGVPASATVRTAQLGVSATVSPDCAIEAARPDRVLVDCTVPAGFDVSVQPAAPCGTAACPAPRARDAAPIPAAAATGSPAGRLVLVTISY